MNLVEASALTKKIVLITSMVLFITVGGWFLKGAAISAYRTLFPPKDPPSVGFGLLEPLQFVDVTNTSEEVEYVLNTSNGRLPNNFPDKFKVFKYTPKPFSYSSGSDAQEDAETLGFTDDMRTSSLTSTVFAYKGPIFGGELIIDTERDIIILDTPMRGIGKRFPAGVLERDRTIRDAIKILEDLNRSVDPLFLEEDLGAEYEVIYGKTGTEGLIEANSILEAQVMRVDFHRNLNNLPILSYNPYQAMVQVGLRKHDYDQFSQLNYPIMRVISWLINTEESATYPLVPISVAWEEVSNNRGALVGARPGGTNPFDAPVSKFSANQILINDIYLAYYDGLKAQKFLQPIYVFEGNYTSATGKGGNISIYYPAISPEFFETYKGDDANETEETETEAGANSAVPETF